jgi:nucleotide-binding universal stress UspA family protein
MEGETMTKRTMICVNMNDDSINLLRDELSSWSWDGVDDVHFVYGFTLQTYTDAFYFTRFPTEDQYEAIESSVVDVMNDLGKSIFTSKVGPNITFAVKMSSSPKETLAEYALANKIDEMIIGTRGKNGIAGLFSSSFAEYMVRNAPCALRVLRTKK